MSLLVRDHDHPRLDLSFHSAHSDHESLATHSAWNEDVLHNASKKGQAEINAGKRKDFEGCRDCRAESLVYDLYQSIIGTSKAILKDVTDAHRKVESLPPTSRSGAIVDDSHSTPQIVSGPNQHPDQQKAGIEEKTSSGLDTIAKDSKMIKSHARENSEPKKKEVTKVRTGCDNCKRRRVRCDEGKPYCARCTRRSEQCEGYHPPRLKMNDKSAGVTADETKIVDDPTNDSLKRRSLHTLRKHQRAEAVQSTHIDKGIQEASSYQAPYHVTDEKQSRQSSTEPNLPSGDDVAVEETTADESHAAQTIGTTRSNPRRLLHIVTSFLLVDDLIRPDTVRTIAKCDPDLYEIIVDLLLECATDLDEFGSSPEEVNSSMKTLADLIMEAPCFERKRSRLSAGGKRPKLDEVLTKIERNVSLLMDLTTTIEDLVHDPNRTEITAQQHVSKYCVRHVSLPLKGRIIREPLAKPYNFPSQLGIDPSSSQGEYQLHGFLSQESEEGLKTGLSSSEERPWAIVKGLEQQATRMRETIDSLREEVATLKQAVEQKDHMQIRSITPSRDDVATLKKVFEERDRMHVSSIDSLRKDIADLSRAVEQRDRVQISSVSEPQDASHNGPARGPRQMRD